MLNTGVQLGDVVGATRMSPFSILDSSASVHTTLTIPSATPGEPHTPKRSAFSSGLATGMLPTTTFKAIGSMDSTRPFMASSSVKPSAMKAGGLPRSTQPFHSAFLRSTMGLKLNMSGLMPPLRTSSGKRKNMSSTESMAPDATQRLPIPSRVRLMSEWHMSSQ